VFRTGLSQVVLSGILPVSKSEIQVQVGEASTVLAVRLGVNGNVTGIV